MNACVVAPAVASTRPVAHHARTGARVLLGLVFFGFGLMGVLAYFRVIPMPGPSTPPPEAAAAFSAAMMKTGYMFPLVKFTEVIAGALLLANRFVPLALALLAPVVVNIVAFHAFLAPAGLWLPLVVLALEIGLAYAYRATYRTMLAARV
jgi:hypothetical protein